MLNKTHTSLSPEELEFQYNPSQHVSNVLDILASYESLSQQQYQNAKNATLDIAYGDLASHTYDFFAPITHNTGFLYVFIHGGYWQLLSKKESAWMACTLQQQGCSVAVVDYTLCPHTTVAGIVAECQRVIVHLVNNAKKLGFDAHKIIICGHSAGGHLAIMMGLTNWKNFTISNPIHGIIAISGVFDVTPLVKTSNNDALKLSENQAKQLSPMYKDAVPTCPILVAWGQYDTAEFIRQSKDYAEKLTRTGANVTTLQVPNKNHFDVVLDFGIMGTSIMEASLAMMHEPKE